MITMTILHKTEDQIVSINPSLIPRKGDRINFAYSPELTVVKVLWDYGTETSLDTKITVFVA